MNYSVTGEQLTAIADAIRTKMHGTARTAQIEFPDGFTSKISGIGASLSVVSGGDIIGYPGWTVPANGETKVIENKDGLKFIKDWTFSNVFTAGKYCYFRTEPKPQFGGGYKTDVYLVNPTDSEVTTVGNVTIDYYTVTAVI